jgi:branched-chain amino acid transport system permease protein
VVTLASGLALGVAYALIGTAVATVAIATRTLHLAIGPILVLGVLTSVTVVGLGAPPGVGLLAGVAVGAGVSGLLAPAVLMPLSPRDGSSPTAPLRRWLHLGREEGEHILRWLVGFAVVGAMIELLVVRFLSVREFRPRPLIGGDGHVVVAGTALPQPLLVAIAVGGIAAVALALALRVTRWGRRLRVVGGSPAAAVLGGVPPWRVRTSALAVSGAAAVLAGVLVAPVTFIGSGQGAAFTVRGVAAAALLGGGPARIAASGLLLGLAEAGAQSVWPEVRGDVAIAVVVLLLLAVRGGERRRTWGRAW